MPVYVYLMEDKNPLNPSIIREHIDHLRRLDEAGRLIVCGPFTDHPGGMVVFEAQTMDDAVGVATSDPFITFGYKTYTIRTLERADASNGYLG